MQDEITVTPLVDILSLQLGKQVVMSGDEYVLMEDNSIVEQGDVDVAVIEQDRLMNERSMITAIASWKASRAMLVENIEVVYNNIVFQGDETSQGRMSRAINGLPNDTDTVSWRAKDNTTVNLNKIDFKAILFEAGTQQSDIWNTVP